MSWLDYQQRMQNQSGAPVARPVPVVAPTRPWLGNAPGMPQNSWLGPAYGGLAAQLQQRPIQPVMPTQPAAQMSGSGGLGQVLGQMQRNPRPAPTQWPNRRMLGMQRKQDMKPKQAYGGLHNQMLQRPVGQ